MYFPSSRGTRRRTALAYGIEGLFHEAFFFAAQFSSSPGLFMPNP